MNINEDILQFYLYKKLIRRKDVDTILSESKRLNIPVRNYMLAKEYTTETTELDALSEYYCMPYIELDMLEIDKALFDKFSLDYMKKNKFVPVGIDKNGVLLIAVGKPLDLNALSAVASVYNGPVDTVLTSPTQIDRYIDSVSAVKSTSDALHALNTESDDKMFAGMKTSQSGDISSADDVINNPAVRLVLYRSRDYFGCYFSRFQLLLSGKYVAGFIKHIVHQFIPPMTFIEASISSLVL